MDITGIPFSTPVELIATSGALVVMGLGTVIKWLGQDLQRNQCANETVKKIGQIAGDILAGLGTLLYGVGRLSFIVISTATVGSLVGGAMGGPQGAAIGFIAGAILGFSRAAYEFRNYVKAEREQAQMDGIPLTQNS